MNRNRNNMCLFGLEFAFTFLFPQRKEKICIKCFLGDFKIHRFPLRLMGKVSVFVFDISEILVAVAGQGGESSGI